MRLLFRQPKPSSSIGRILLTLISLSVISTGVDLVQEPARTERSEAIATVQRDCFNEALHGSDGA